MPERVDLLAGLHHVQLAIPTGAEAECRHFYGDLLGLREAEKPSPLASRGGVWFRGRGIEIHLGVEADFRPARKAHPGFLVEDLDGVAAALERGRVTVRWDGDMPGYRRFYADDPCGNRLEFLEPEASRPDAGWRDERSSRL